ncbi:hypothetical protein ACQKJ1_01435 [Methylorubrum rhodesianum]|uniref:hypothetical protein n=1 Tax=Methylorubrum rhodesianum TaxID=29427 RepID=UPI003D07EE12
MQVAFNPFPVVFTAEFRAEIEEIWQQISICFDRRDYAGGCELAIFGKALVEARYDTFSAQLGIPKDELRTSCLIGSMLVGPIYLSAR